MTLQIILLFAAAAFLILYIGRRRARLKKEGSDKN